MGLLRLLAIIFIVYLVFRLAARFLFPLLAKYFIRKATSNMEERVKSQQAGKKVFEEGDIEIRKMDRRQDGGSSANNEDDYIDFEEVE